MSRLLHIPRVTFLCPKHWNPEEPRLIPGFTRAYWGTANIRPRSCYWFLLPNILAN